VIARKGLSVKPYAILKVTDRDGHVLYTYKAPPPQQLVDPGVARSLTQMMQAVTSYGTGKKAAIDRPCAGKTGTTQLYKDLWFVGFTPELVTGVWAGNDDNTSLDPKPGSPSVKLWRLFMAETPRSVPSFYAAEPREEVSSIPQEPEAEQPSGGLLDQLIEDLFGG
jgi:penicillin-binding protein 1A